MSFDKNLDNVCSLVEELNRQTVQDRREGKLLKAAKDSMLLFKQLESLLITVGTNTVLWSGEIGEWSMCEDVQKYEKYINILTHGGIFDIIMPAFHSNCMFAEGYNPRNSDHVEN